MRVAKARCLLGEKPCGRKEGGRGRRAQPQPPAVREGRVGAEVLEDQTFSVGVITDSAACKTGQRC